MAASASPVKGAQRGSSRKSILKFLKKSYHKSKPLDNAADGANHEQDLGAAQYVAPSWSPMSCIDPICFEKAASQEENIFHTSLVKINNINVESATDLNPFGRLKFGYLDVTAPMCSMSWLELTENFVICTHGEPFVYWDYIIPDEPALFEYLFDKYDATFNPQTLADRNIQHPIDEGDCSIMLSDGGTRWIMPVKRERASKDCATAKASFTSVPNVKKEVLSTLLQDTPVQTKSSGKKNRTTAEYDECEFWLLEVERSMSPAGLVLKRVRDDIFARVGYFAVNSPMDPEIVCLPGRIQTRGRKTWNWGGPEEKNTWNDRFEKRRIYLV